MPPDVPPSAPAPSSAPAAVPPPPGADEPGAPPGERPTLHQADEQFRLGHWDALDWRNLALVYPWRLLLQVWRQMAADRVLVRASSLAFFTVLSLVPLMAVAGSLLLAFGSSEGEPLIEKLQKYLLPVIGDEVTEFVVAAIERATEAGLGPVGALALIVTAVALILQIEQVFNDIWRVGKRRPLYVRVLLFYAVITLGPLVMSFSLYFPTSLPGADLPTWAVDVFDWLVPIGLSAVLFVFAYKLLPHTRVAWRYAAVAALVTALLFEVAKAGFRVYVSDVFGGGYDVIYGPVGVIPVFLMWVYVSWLVVLLGAVIAYAMQNLRPLMLDDKVRRKLSDAPAAGAVSSAAVAAEIFAPVARAFAAGDGPASVERIAAESGYGLLTVNATLTRLEDAGLVLHAEVAGVAGYLPARPIEDIGLLAILAPFAVDEHKRELTPALRAVLRRLHDGQRAALGTLTARDLLGRDAGARPPVTEDLAGEAESD